MIKADRENRKGQQKDNVYARLRYICGKCRGEFAKWIFFIFRYIMGT